MEKDTNKQQKKVKSGNVAAKSLRSLLGGYFLTKERTVKHLPFLFFLALLAIIYIGNSYYAEKNIRHIERTQKKLKELRYEYITTKSKLMHSSRQSMIAKSLTKKGIKESTVPPEKIFVKKE